MRFAWGCAISWTLAACSSGFSATQGTEAGARDAADENPEIQGGDSGEITVDATSPSDSGHPDGGPADAASDGSSADAGCSGLVCGGACVPNDDVHNCGTCGHDCTSLPHVSGPVTCSASGACTFPVSSCSPGWTQCLSNPDLGCETNIATTANCGSCGNACTGNTPSCSGSGSTYGCVSGCPGVDPTLCSGTCVDTTSNANDCSTCGNACSTTMAHAQPTCVASACSFSCNTGYPLCGGTCIDPTNDDNNCNGCGNKCAAGMHCVSSACTCAVGLLNCGGKCIDPSSTAADCGTCGHSCIGGTCAGGACQPWVVVQAPTSQDVNAIAADGQYLVWDNDDSLPAVEDVPLSGGPPVTVYSQGFATGVAVTGGTVELMSNATSSGEEAIYSGTAGQAGSATMLTEVQAQLVGTYAGPVFDPAGANSYFAWSISGGAELFQCPVGGACVQLQDPQATTGKLHVRATNTAVFLLDEGGGSIGSLYMQVPKQNPTVVATFVQGTALAVDSANVYWSTATSVASVYTTTVYAQSFASGSTPRTVISVSGYVAYMAADGTNVYFAVSSSPTANPASIQYVPIGGATSTKTLWTGTIARVDLVAAAGAIYWVQGDDSTVEGLRFP